MLVEMNLYIFSLRDTQLPEFYNWKISDRVNFPKFLSSLPRKKISVRIGAGMLI